MLLILLFSNNQIIIAECRPFRSDAHPHEPDVSSCQLTALSMVLTNRSKLPVTMLIAAVFGRF